MADLVQTNFTAATHRTSYPAIYPTRPELNQAGRTILITGGGTGIGKAIAKNFVFASAATVIIIARRANLLEDAVKKLEQAAKDVKSPTKFIARSCDVTNSAEVESVWDGLVADGTTVDVLVLNAAKFTDTKTIFELGVEEVWSQLEVNVKGLLLLTERFYKQISQNKKFLINVSTASIHMLQHPGVVIRPAYSLSKASGTLAVQLLANTITADKMQIISFHPGVIWGDGWISSGITKDMLPFDDDDLPGAFAVWAAAEEASFLHGRYVWASWDVIELSKKKTRAYINENTEYLRFGIIGLKGQNRA